MNLHIRFYSLIPLGRDFFPSLPQSVNRSALEASQYCLERIEVLEKIAFASNLKGNSAQ